MHHKEIFDNRKERIRPLFCTVTLGFKPDILFNSCKSFMSPCKDRAKSRTNILVQGNILLPHAGLQGMQYKRNTYILIPKWTVCRLTMLECPLHDYIRTF